MRGIKGLSIEGGGYEWGWGGVQAWGQEGGLEGVWVSCPDASRKHREERADMLWIGCKVQGIQHFCHRALAALLKAFSLPAGKSAGEKG